MCVWCYMYNLTSRCLGGQVVSITSILAGPGALSPELSTLCSFIWMLNCNMLKSHPSDILDIDLNMQLFFI